MKTSKITVYIHRSFSVGFHIYSPSKNGLYIEIQLACFGLRIWSRGKQLFKFDNYWNC